MKSTQFRTKAAAMAFIQEQGVVLSCNSNQLTLKDLQGKINQYLQARKHLHKKSGPVGSVSLDETIHFSTLCHGNGDMLIASSNLTRNIYTIITTFDGVGIVGMVVECVGEVYGRLG